MRKIVTVYSAILIICGGCKETARTFDQAPTVAITTIGDPTDKLVRTPRGTDVIDLYRINVDDNIHRGYECRYREISDVSQTDVLTLSVRPEYPLLANNNERIAELKAFEERVGKMFGDAEKDYQRPIGHSLVYVSLVSEANRMARLGKEVSERYILVYSNMIDNADYLSMYQPSVQEMMAHHPEAVMAQLEHTMKLDDNLNGLRVLIIYQSPNGDTHNDKLFLLASNWYRLLLESHGAKVLIVPNISAALSDETL